MENNEKIDLVQKDLDLILKKGDLYDIICDKVGVKPRTNMLIKANILFLSRILYVGVLIHDKIQSYFSPIEEIKKAQDNIRKSIGLNIDVVRTKKEKDDSIPLLEYKKRNLAILYENDTESMVEYTEHLKHILTFCELYSINDILLNEMDIISRFTNIDLDSCFENTENITSLSTYFYEIKEDIILFNRSELLKLIQKLEIEKIDKKTISSFYDKIEDTVIKNAIHDFCLFGNLDKLKAIVVNRLNLIINNDNSMKDKVYGKIIENVKVNEEYITIIKNTKDGITLSNDTMTLYDYLGVINYNSLLRKIELEKDNKELYSIAAFHLYLCKSKKKKGNNHSVLSFYDEIYEDFQKSQTIKSKKIEELPTKKEKIYYNIKSLFLSFVFTCMVFSISFLTGLTVDMINWYFNYSSNLAFSIKEEIFSIYRQSLEFEKSLFSKPTEIVEDITTEISNLIGDALSDGDKIVAIVKAYPDVQIPVYYGEEYATSATYNKGTLEYNLTSPKYSYYDFEEVAPLFIIETDIIKKDLKKDLKDNTFDLKNLIYPLEDNYVPMYLYIIDNNDSEKVVRINATRANTSGGVITEQEKEILLSMSDPKLNICYGMSKEAKNIFENSLEKEDSYTSLLPNEIRESITSGLGIDKNATIEEIYKAIKNKEYSKTPIKDAGLTRKIKKMGEWEYFNTIASLDSTVCNLAATLAVTTNDDLIYTVGYKIYDSYFSNIYITTSNTHSWGMSKDGKIIDVTPAGSFVLPEENVIETILDWGIEFNISSYIMALLMILVVRKLFGKEIKLYLKASKIERILEKPKIEDAYAKIKDELYGGINVPVKKEPLEYIEMLSRELDGYSEEELKKLKQELQKMKDTKLATKLLDEIPYIRENEEEIKRILSKKE